MTSRTSRSRPKPRRRFPPEILTPAEVEALMRACVEGSPPLPGVRNRALIALLYRSGLRIAEALDLYEKDLDLDRSALRVLNGKGGRFRVSGIDASGLAPVTEWLALRKRYGLGAGHPVFCTMRGDRLSASYVRRAFKRLGVAAGIAKRVHPHGLRHTHASELRSEGFDIGIISRQLGHRDISTTARYLNHVAPWAVVEAVSGRVQIVV
ncbi:MAG: tyrosine-type recombinase/integrase [Phycisphaeraceae bacterium]|nr:tyrosine-type recombinase/integrase [Phycisphaeraceae bacterium]